MRCHEPIENTPTETLLAWFDANLKIYRGTRTEAGVKIGDLVSVVWYSAQAAGVSGNGWDETGHAI